jgi:hypothetical protein
MGASDLLKTKTPISKPGFLWAVLDLFRTTSFPKNRGKYGSMVLLFRILAVGDEIVKAHWRYLFSKQELNLLVRIFMHS